MPVEWDSKDFDKKLQDFAEQGLLKAVQTGLERACIVVETAAKVNCPVDDGVLRASITHDVEGTEGYIGSNVEYAPYVHQGTGIYAVNKDGRQEVPWKYQDAEGHWHTIKGQKPNPFLQKAIDENQDQVLKQFEGLL